MKKLFRILSFRFTREDCLGFTRGEFYLGLFITWLVGIGRYWDHPKANLAQYLGLGSVVYIFLLSSFIWIIVYPLRKQHWHYFQVLTFVSFVSLPALLYAIPVERFMEMPSAVKANVWFLQIVALWRVLLLVVFLYRYAQLSFVETFVATLLPLTIIVTALSFLNLEHAVFEIMAGIERSGTPYDGAYYFLLVLMVGSLVVLPFLLVGYGWLIFKATQSRKQIEKT